MFCIDLHIHTSYGSPCGYMTPEEAVLRAKGIGLDGLCITEHNFVWSREAIRRLNDQSEILVIGGVEVGTDQGHVLVFGLHDPVRHVVQAEELREMVDRSGGVMVLAHPFRGEINRLHPRPSVRSWAKRPILRMVDGIEVYNGHAGGQETEFACRLAKFLNLPQTGGSDAHAVLGIGHCYTLFERRIAHEGDLVKEIREGRCRAAVWNGPLRNR